MSPRIVLITGVMAAGKSTVAQALAERLPKSVHLRGDVFRKMMVNGRAEPAAELSPEAESQLRLRYRIAVEVAKRYFDAGFSVVYQDIVIGEALAEVAGMFEGYPLSVVVLCPDRMAVARREAARVKTGYGRPEDIEFFDRVLREETPRSGLWIDSTELGETETVERIVKDLEGQP